MARRKVQLAWIPNHSMRNSTFRKRKKGLMKKASELATLCGINVCVVVFGPEEQQPDVWPSAPEAADTLAALRSMPEMDQSKKMMDREGFLRQQLTKFRDQVHRMQRENGELETEALMHQCLAGRSLQDVSAAADLSRLWWMLDMKLKLIKNRLDRAEVACRGKFPLQDADTPAAGANAGLTMTNPTAAVDHPSLLMLGCPSKATEVLQTHDWPLMDQTTKEKGPSFGAAMQALQSQSWNAGAAVDVPRQSMAFDDGGKSAVAPTGWSLYDHLLYDPSFFSMN